jgi:hypothetical protein
VNCVVLWQALHTWQCSVEGSVHVCCCTMLSCKLIQLFWRMQVIHSLKMSVTINNLTNINPQQWNCQQRHHCENL